MLKLRTEALRWGVGAYCATLGACMLVAPHQFGNLAFASLQPHMGAWGAFFLFSGVCLIAVAGVAPRGALAIGAHLMAGAALLVVGIGVTPAAPGRPPRAIYSWASARPGPLAGAHRRRRPAVGAEDREHLSRVGRPASAAWAGDLLALLLGLATSVNGLIFLLAPGQFAAPFYDLIRGYLPWYGLGYLASGLAVCWVLLRPVRWRVVFWGAHLALSGALLAFMLGSPLPNGSWTGVLYYGGFGVLAAVLPWLGPRLHAVDSHALQTRLAISLAVAAALPLVLVAALAADLQARTATLQALANEQALATALAQDVSDYVGLHRAAVEALALEPGLLQRPPADQLDHLRALNQLYPDVQAFSVVDAGGNQIARSDGLPPLPVNGLAVFEEIRRTNAPWLDVVVSASARLAVADHRRAHPRRARPLRWGHGWLPQARTVGRAAGPRRERHPRDRLPGRQSRTRGGSPGGKPGGEPGRSGRAPARRRLARRHGGLRRHQLRRRRTRPARGIRPRGRPRLGRRRRAAARGRAGGGTRRPRPGAPGPAAGRRRRGGERCGRGELPGRPARHAGPCRRGAHRRRRGRAPAAHFDYGGRSPRAAGRRAARSPRRPHGRARRGGARAGARPRPGDRGLAAEVRVPGQHEPRDPHADERRHRHDRPAARHRADAEQREYAETVRQSGEALLDDHQRHPGLLEDRGRQARAGDIDLDVREWSRTWSTCSPSRRRRRGLELACQIAERRAARSARRSRPPAPGPDQPRRQRRQVHRARRDRRARGLRRPRVGARRPRRRPRSRRRRSCASRSSTPGIGIPREAQARAVPAVLPGRQLDDPPVRRHRAGPGDLQAAGRS